MNKDKLFSEMEAVLRELLKVGTFYSSAIEICVHEGKDGEVMGNSIEKIIEEIDDAKTRTEG